MGVQCSQINKICQGDDNIDIKIEKVEENDKNENNNNDIKNLENNNLLGLEGIVSFSTKKINRLDSQKEILNLTPAQKNLMSNISQFKSKTLKKTKTSVFSDFVSDIPFNNYGTIDKNDIFETNYITLKDNYNEETLDYINKIRNEPKSIIKDIDNLLKIENKEEKILIEKEETHEYIIFEDNGNTLKEVKSFLNKVNSIKTKFNLNEDLSMDTSELEKNDNINTNKKITKILVDKRKHIINKYPNCQFFVNFIKDIKINILYLLSENEDKSNFRNVIFNSKYTEFNITWAKEKKNNFISFLCFA